ncbi:Hypothetical predicted protein [Mytilus galloprovincialis]|uniref:Uncharacterized protein n=1 Tax=Mytilus galloprovincialis TaxID=29158 RepID=A0A8B6F688_MYTGA|nr:Hypothetical predicted protein [Mytilus galloprovincialis]
MIRLDRTKKRSRRKYRTGGRKQQIEGRSTPKTTKRILKVKLDADFDISTLPNVPITFELQLAEDINAEVVNLFENMHQEVEYFPEMLLHAITSINNDQTLTETLPVPSKTIVETVDVKEQQHNLKPAPIQESESAQGDLKI